MATILEQVHLTGKVRGFPASAIWVRVQGGWEVTVELATKRKTHLVTKHYKPCWTCSLPFIEQLIPCKSLRQKRVRVAPIDLLIPMRRVK